MPDNTLTPQVTVLMSVFNGANTVSQAIESIRAQTFTGWELLIIDDASTDETPAILARAAGEDPRIRVIRNSSNLGLAASLNRGLREAQGELIARMDADDLSMPGRLERQVRFLADHDDVDVVGGAAELIDGANRPLGRITPAEWHDRLVARRYIETPFIHPSIMARRHFFAALRGYDERLRKAQDTDLWLRAADRFRFHNLPDVLIRYRYRTPTFTAVAYGTYVLLRSARREGRLFSRAAFALRYLLGSLLAKARLAGRAR